MVAIAALLYIITRAPEKFEIDSEIDKFARVQTDLAIEAEHYYHDDSLFTPVKDSILKHYEVTQKWIDQIKTRVDRHPEDWVKVYDLMIEYAEGIKDSLMHQKPPRDDSTSSAPPEEDK